MVLNLINSIKQKKTISTSDNKITQVEQKYIKTFISHLN